MRDSGKTTTLYATLNYLNSPELNILTIEDPIECDLDGINQSQVKSDIGYTFAQSLRSFLRQDPDIIMVGEIRDQETDEIAVRAALTGHLVLSTLHINDAPSALTRLLDMGLEPFLISSSVKMVIAQRLVQKICDHCKTESGVSKYYITSWPQILAEYKSTNELEAEYIYALGRMVAKLDPSKGYLWIYVDHLNSTRLMDGPDSQTDMRRDYYPYGQAYLAMGNDQTAYQFTGKEIDNVTGLYYFGARYYDRKIGRWLVPDPAGQVWSPYVYAGTAPSFSLTEMGAGSALMTQLDS